MSTGRNTAVSLAVLALALGAVAAVVPGYLAAEQADVIRRGPGVAAVHKLSRWFPALAGTNGDTDVYVMDSGKAGATGLVLGGTHGNEPAGYMTAIVIVENAVPASGRLLVVPHANRSSMTHTDYQEASPRVIEFQGTSGRRAFRYGSRRPTPPTSGRIPISTCTLHQGSSCRAPRRGTSTAPTPAARTARSPSGWPTRSRR